MAIEYIGTRLCGSQKQLTDRTVVGVLEDAGVHALSNVCHVDIEQISKRKPGEVLQPHEPAVVGRAFNHFLQRPKHAPCSTPNSLVISFCPSNFTFANAFTFKT
ncbi:hypothetical protein TSUD_288660 [Trifolium subterraneum]|uniref:Uncharacterized protein n=1 Tax=Trifolium subterraneum TaxID=3900 RepID=A0A2Z6PPI3_TRISU|nr:hypothetical protein TSUD_288660 [Trifolium subterraneum]